MKPVYHKTPISVHTPEGKGEMVVLYESKSLLSPFAPYCIEVKTENKDGVFFIRSFEFTDTEGDPVAVVWESWDPVEVGQYSLFYPVTDERKHIVNIDDLLEIEQKYLNPL